MKLSALDLTPYSRDQLVDLIRQCAVHLESSPPLASPLREQAVVIRDHLSDQDAVIEHLTQRLKVAEQEAEYWKGVADSLEFGTAEKPDYSRG